MKADYRKIRLGSINDTRTIKNAMSILKYRNDRNIVEEPTAIETYIIPIVDLLSDEASTKNINISRANEKKPSPVVKGINLRMQLIS